MIRSRYRRITFFFARVLLSILWWDLLLPRIGFRSLARRTRPERLRKIAAQFRLLAIDMGGVMIKVGQFFSSRVDVLPQEITAELSGLQDEVPAVDLAQIKQVAEPELGAPLEQKFLYFDPVPMAAASLGQVHRARVRVPVEVEPLPEEEIIAAGGNGHPPKKPAPETEWIEQNVVVKIQRPKIADIIATDLAALRTVGNWVEKYPPVRKRADVKALLAEFSRVTYEEIDYLHEGKNAEKFAQDFRGDSDVLVPRVFWTYTTERVLTLEDVQSIKITDYAAITAAGIDRKQVAIRLLDTYLKQIFEDGFFHADPHPGNLFVYPLTSPQGDETTPWQLTFVDFGMTGRLSPQMRAGMRELLIAVGTRDAARMVRSFKMLGVLLPDADLTLIEQAEFEVLNRFWGKNMSELVNIDYREIRELMGQFRELVYSLPFQVPEDLVFLGRTVSILSGMCTGLDPEFNVWEAIAPYAQKLVTEETANGHAAWLDTLIQFAQNAIQLPVRAESMLEKMERGQLMVRDRQLSDQVHHLEKSVRKAGAGIVFAALLLAGIQLYLAGQTGFGISLLVLSGLIFLWILWPW
jgi:predicted unusual protein kinase regulating ubiquinone biosynthesis (AarF/ABC1/UbiB family)